MKGKDKGEGKKMAKAVQAKMAGSPFKDNLEKLMREQNLTQQDLADKAGTQRSTIANWLSNKSPRDLEAVYRLARALGVSFSELLMGVREKTDEPRPSIVLPAELELDASQALSGLYQIHLVPIRLRSSKKAGMK